MTTNVPATAVSAFNRQLPGPTSPDWNDPAVVADIARVPRWALTEWKASPEELVATYGTADPDALAKMGALDVDIADARRHASAALAGAA